MSQPAEYYPKMDDIDCEILRGLEQDARISQTALAAIVGLSANAVAARVRRLQESGVLRGFRADVSADSLGFGLHALIEVKMEPSTTAKKFEERIRKTIGVVRAMVTTGNYDWTLEVLVKDQQELQRVIEDLRAGGLARETYTRVIAMDFQLPVMDLKPKDSQPR